MSLTPEQIEVRRHGIGGSEIAAIAGLPSMVAPIDVWRGKTDPTFQRESSFRMELGTLVEPVVLELLRRRLGQEVGGGDALTFKHPTLPLVASPDGFAYEAGGPRRGGPRLVEAKITNKWMLADWGPDGSDIVPKQYVAQCQHNMFVLRALGMPIQEALVPVLVDFDAFLVFRVPYAEDIAQGLARAACAWWGRHVIANVPPPPDGTPSYSAFLEATYPRAERGPEIVAPDNMNPVAGRYEEALATKKQAEKSQREAEQQLCAALGEAETMVGDGWVARWRADKNGNRRFRLVRGEQ